MQTPADVAPQPAPPAPPAPVLLPGGGGTRVLVSPSTQGVPTTARELRALKQRQSELGSQLESAAGRRKRLSSELDNTANPVTAAGITERIKVLDARIVQLEQDLAQTGQLIAAAPASALAGSSVDPGQGGGGLRIDDEVFGVGLVLALAMVGVLGVLRRFVFRRRVVPAPVQGRADSERLERLEQAVETIAVEIERVSEGQRFVTRLLSESRAESPHFAAQRQGELLGIPVKSETPQGGR